MKALARVVVMAFSIAILIAAFGSPAWASNFKDSTVFTFTVPVELPGVASPAGPYVFKVLDSMADRNEYRSLTRTGPISTQHF